MTRPQAMRTAREMWDDGDGWSIGEIRQYLGKHGQPVSWTTLRCWVDAAYADARNRQRRERMRKRSRDVRGTTQFLILDADARSRLGLNVSEPAPTMTPDLLLALRLEDGLSYSAIAAVARRFFDQELTPEQWRDQLTKMGAPKNAKKAANARAQARRRQMKAAA